MTDAFKKRYLDAKRALFRKYYGERLNPEQCDAVLSCRGPLLILAGAGSGKTTVLVNRIAHIINYGDAYYRGDEAPEGMNTSYMQYLIDYGDNIQIRDFLKQTAVSPAFPSRVLCVTFTNKAANELKERLIKIRLSFLVRQAISIKVVYCAVICSTGYSLHRFDGIAVRRL